jgi:hypothetical protein
MTSTWQRIDDEGRAYRVAENPFLDATITTVPKHGERAAESAAYVHVPGRRTRLTYYVDEALKEAGVTVRIGLNPSIVKLIDEPAVGLLTGNGPQTIDAHRSAPPRRCRPLSAVFEVCISIHLLG